MTKTLFVPGHVAEARKNAGAAFISPMPLWTAKPLLR